jgi:hypothetical protein
MNVLMPTAMSTMHEQEELRQSSARTAKRGLCVLKSLTGQNTLVKDNAQAILATATDEKVEESTLTQVCFQAPGTPLLFRSCSFISFDTICPSFDFCSSSNGYSIGRIFSKSGDTKIHRKQTSRRL